MKGYCDPTETCLSHVSLGQMVQRRHDPTCLFGLAIRRLLLVPVPAHLTYRNERRLSRTINSGAGYQWSTIGMHNSAWVLGTATEETDPAPSVW